MLSWNVRSICNKYEAVMEHILDNSADFVFLSETWLTYDSNIITSYFNALGYNLYHKHRESQRGGGVAILSKYIYKMQELKYNSYSSFEYCSYTILHSSGKKIILVSLYRPPNSNVSDFLKQFTELLEFFVTYNAELVITGDVNIHLDIVSTTSKSFFDILSMFNLCQNIYHPTHTLGHTLDVVITSRVLETFNVSCSDVNLSDHFPVNFSLNLSRQAIPSKEITVRNYKNFSEDAFHNDFIHGLDSITFDSQDFLSVITAYDNVCKTVFNVHAPLKVKIIKIVPHAPWFDEQYSTLRRKRRKAEKNLKKPTFKSTEKSL